MVLSPFVVQSDADTGYQARSTLLGSRLNTPLRDLASPITVMTKDLLSDLAATTLDEALRYSINVENTSEFISANTNGGDFNTGIINNYSANRSRGLSTAGRSHDLFATALFPDSYNFERITIASGPNSILFGLGNSSGTIDVTFKRANTERRFGEIQLKLDDNESLRGSLDYNFPVIDRKLALRVAAVKADMHSFREPDYEKTERLFATLTYTPSAKTSLRAWMEHAHVDRQPARNTVIFDKITPWLAAGRPIFNNAVGAAFPAATDPVFARETSVVPVFVFGQTAGAIPIRSWVNTVVTGGPDKLLASPDNLDQTLVDSSIFPHDVNFTGNGTLNFTSARILGVSLEQQLGDNFFLEAAYNEENIRNPFVDFVRGVDLELHVDANRFLPDQVTPNPNLGRFYTQGTGRGGLWHNGRREGRFTGTYQADLTGRSAWLGRHRVTGLLSRAQDYDAQQAFDARIINSDATFGDPNANLNVNTRQLRFRSYLSNPADPATGSIYWVNLPYVGFENTVLPGGVTVATLDNPYGATAPATLTNTSVDSAMASLQSYWWKDRIVTLFGWRKDRVRQATADTPRIGTNVANSPFAHVYTLGTFRSNYDFWDEGQTDFQSVVVHPTPWLSFHYSRSGTYAPSRSSHNPDGSLVPGSTGEGKDYGFTLNLWEERLTLKANRFENTVGPDQSTYRAILRDPVDQIEDTLFANGGNTNTGGYDPTRPQAFWEVVADREAEGYELELVANPTRNLRLLLTATKTEAVESNIGAPWVAYIESRLSAWRPFANTPLAANANRTVSQRFNDLVVAINTIRQADGQATEQSRKYRVNLTTRYSLPGERLKGAYVGGAYQWRSKAALGYRSKTATNLFEFPGVPASVVVPDLSQPIYSDPVTSFDAFAGYRRKLWRDRIEWSLQLNVRNVLDSDDHIVQQILSTGQIAKFTIQEPRSFILTSTFSF